MKTRSAVPRVIAGRAMAKDVITRGVGVRICILNIDVAKESGKKRIVM